MMVPSASPTVAADANRDKPRDAGAAASAATPAPIPAAPTTRNVDRGVPQRRSAASDAAARTPTAPRRSRARRKLPRRRVRRCACAPRTNPPGSPTATPPRAKDEERADAPKQTRAEKRSPGFAVDSVARVGRGFRGRGARRRSACATFVVVRRVTASLEFGAENKRPGVLRGVLSADSGCVFEPSFETSAATRHVAHVIQSGSEERGETVAKRPPKRGGEERGTSTKAGEEDTVGPALRPRAKLPKSEMRASTHPSTEPWPTR